MNRADGNARHVLVIEDDQRTRELIREVLEEEGYRVTRQPRPNLEAAAVAALAPDLVVIDLLFDREPLGLAFLKQLKAASETRAIPVLVCSADHQLLDRFREQLAAWDCGVLAKPFGLDELLADVQGCLARGEDAAAARDSAGQPARSG